MCLPKETFSAPENTSCSRKYNMPQEILSNAGNIPSCYRKYFLSQKIFPVPDYITCPSIYSLLPRKKVLPQEIFLVTGNISCSRICLLVIDKLSH